MNLLLKSLVMGMLVVAAGRSTQAGTYTDTPLSPGSQPPAALGNDLLLAENVAGPVNIGTTTIPAASWTTDLQLGDGDASHGFTGTVITLPNAKNPTRIFDGKGSTGTYSGGTIGAGKHTENTKTDIQKFYVSGTGVLYQYIFHEASYNPTTGTKNPIFDVKGGYKVCP